MPIICRCGGARNCALVAVILTNLAGSRRTAHPRIVSNDRRSIFRLGVVDLGVEQVKLPNGLEIELAIIRHPGACAVVALDDENCVTLIEQYRHAVGRYLWEIPAGCREPSESSERCAERELLEETGITAKRWEHLGSLVTIPSFCDERIELFLAREISYGTPHHEPDEVIRVQRIRVEEAVAMIDRGEIVDAKTVAGLYRASAFLKRGQNSGAS